LPFNQKDKQTQLVYGIHKKQKSAKQKKDFQSIQIDAHGLHITNRTSSAMLKSCEPSSQYRTVPIVAENDVNKNAPTVNEDEMMKTCPDFKKK
jgi:hypothetical protein